MRVTGQGTEMVDDIAIGPWDGWPWSLHGIVPAAHQAAYNGTPATIIWHFQLENRFPD